jgi:hypothetical protein
MDDPRARPAGATEDDEERVPLFGTWRRIYTAVIACALTAMALIALFSNWDW